MPSHDDVEILRLVSTPGRSLALTYDDGPNPPHTEALLEVLAREEVRAVFFLVGEQVERHPGLVRRIVAEGHVIGNHSWRHDDMGTWEPEAIRADLERTLAAIEAVVPGTPVPFFRAPFGSWGRSVGVARELGMRSVEWQLAVMGWETPGTEVLEERILGVGEQGIVLLHDGGGDRSQTVEATARVIPRLRAAGWSFALPG